ncbi:DUF2461 domain-containing protein [Microbacter margulisiae]|uniref:Uncharacterized protein (TIGR02453 family) n=1 Tax=Microbacter margulisiae TaxID=1350067 RepID=A0A7W5DRV8_9PORP|nr:DUF2461 domain-containing protein [Microbacter margulisiae]MBB3187598.1 uncharacterized protein (TIGR02453 family) [Microbacter margulisiae]
MSISAIIPFLRELQENNNREWFTANKEHVSGLQREFLRFTQQIIDGIALFDPEMKGVDAKNCVFRIYRDIRFSPDKTPYKTHFGAYMAAAGGRKSERAGYYLHMEPDGCFISNGIYCPDKDILKAIRQAILENMDEWEEITGNIMQYFPNQFEEEKLKKVPQGFPSDVPGADWLKYKHYTFSHPLADTFYEKKDIIPELLALFQHSVKLNQFINFTIDELHNR